MDFSLALGLLKDGHSIQRTGWRGKGLQLHLQVPDAGSKMTLPYIFLRYQDSTVPWLASQTDLLADDWVVAELKSNTFDAPIKAPAKEPTAVNEPAKRRGRPKGSVKAKKAVVDPDAPYGRKKDGTAKSAPGRKKTESPVTAAPAGQVGQ